MMWGAASGDALRRAELGTRERPAAHVLKCTVHSQPARGTAHSSTAAYSRPRSRCSQCTVVGCTVIPDDNSGEAHCTVLQPQARLLEIPKAGRITSTTQPNLSSPLMSETRSTPESEEECAQSLLPLDHGDSKRRRRTRCWRRAT